MADTKITSLQPPQVVTNPATDVLPIVNIADPLMATSGSTRKITVNQLLGAGGTATLASATISGDLTVDTSTLKVDSTGNAVGIGSASPAANTLTVGASRYILCSDSQSKIGDNGIINGAATDGNTQIQYFGGKALFFNEGASNTKMTLNSTGLGVGGSPNTGLLTVGATTNASATANALTILSQRATFVVTANGATDAAGTTINYAWANGGQGPLIFRNAAISNVLTLDSSGNVGIGVTPSAVSGQTRVELKGSNGAGYVLRSGSTNTAARDWVIAANVSAFGDFVIRQGNSQGAEPNSGTDRFYIDPSGNTIFTISSTPPTLSANSQLTVNATSNTNLRFSYRGSDGVTRVANLTLA